MLKKVKIYLQRYFCTFFTFVKKTFTLCLNCRTKSLFFIVSLKLGETTLNTAKCIAPFFVDTDDNNQVVAFHIDQSNIYNAEICWMEA